MPSPRKLHRAGTTATSVLLVVVGLAMLATTLARGGGVLAMGILIGVLFVAAGAGRLWIAGKGGR